MTRAEAQETLAFLIGPVLLIAAGFWIWSSLTGSPRLKTAIRRSVLFWVVLLALVLALAALAAATCEGNVLYGYRACTVLPVWLAEFSGGALLLSYLGAILYTLGLLIIGIVVELRRNR